MKKIPFVTVMGRKREVYDQTARYYTKPYSIRLPRAKGAGGYSLIELLIAVAVIGILSAIAVIGVNAVMGGTKESLVRNRLREVAEAQMQFRVSNGRGRYGTLAELRAARTTAGTPVLNPGIAPVDAGGNPVASQGWIVREGTGSPTGEALRTAFLVKAVPADASVSDKAYCMYEDGILRVVAAAAACDRNSPSAER